MYFSTYKTIPLKVLWRILTLKNYIHICRSIYKCIHEHTAEVICFICETCITHDTHTKLKPSLDLVFWSCFVLGLLVLLSKPTTASMVGRFQRLPYWRLLAGAGKQPPTDTNCQWKQPGAQLFQKKHIEMASSAVFTTPSFRYLISASRFNIISSSVTTE